MGRGQVEEQLGLGLRHVELNLLTLLFVAAGTTYSPVMTINIVGYQKLESRLVILYPEREI